MWFSSLDFSKRTKNSNPKQQQQQQQQLKRSKLSAAIAAWRREMKWSALSSDCSSLVSLQTRSGVWERLPIR
jgi:hypothetical protein